MIGAFLHSFIIAKILGIWMIVMSLTLIAKREYMKEVIAELPNAKFASFVYASMMVFLGLALVSLHNLWGYELYVLVTIVCWLLLIKGILWMAFPHGMACMAKKMVDSPLFWLAALVNLVYGVVLLSYAAHFLTVFEHTPA